MHTQNALLGRNTESERKPVVPGAAMHVEAIGAARPKAVIRHRLGEETEERPGEAEADEADLTTVRVPGEDEIPFARRNVHEGAGVVEEKDANGARGTRVFIDHLCHMALGVAEREVEPNELDQSRRRLDVPRLVDEERDAVFIERASHVPGCFVVVIAEAREGSTR